MQGALTFMRRVAICSVMCIFNVYTVDNKELFTLTSLPMVESFLGVVEPKGSRLRSSANIPLGRERLTIVMKLGFHWWHFVNQTKCTQTGLFMVDTFRPTGG